MTPLGFPLTIQEEVELIQQETHVLDELMSWKVTDETLNQMGEDNL